MTSCHNGMRREVVGSSLNSSIKFDYVVCMWQCSREHASAMVLQGNLASCPPPILMRLKYVKEDLKKMRYVFFLSAEKRFKGMKTTPKVCTQKSFFFFNISINNYIFLVKPMPKYFL